ncbi:hypothetical protein J7X09_004665 [Vibrio parahaemolyticus]|nr:hypothetical protein [Vibrio parahaemolyticus]
MFNAIGNRLYTAKVQADIGAQFDQEVDGFLNISVRKQTFINTVVASVPAENFEVAKKQEVKIFYSALISLAAYLAEVMKGNITPNNEVEAAVCLCLINRVERVNLELISEHERAMIYSAMHTLEAFQTK